MTATCLADPIYEVLAETLAEFGKADLPCIHTTVLTQDGYCVGRRFVYDGIQAVWLLAENVIEIYDDDGELLKKAFLWDDPKAA